MTKILVDKMPTIMDDCPFSQRMSGEMGKTLLPNCQLKINKCMEVSGKEQYESMFSGGYSEYGCSKGWHDLCPFLTENVPQPSKTRYELIREDGTHVPYENFSGALNDAENVKWFARKHCLGDPKICIIETATGEVVYGKRAEGEDAK